MEEYGSLENSVNGTDFEIKIQRSAEDLGRFSDCLAHLLNYWVWEGDVYKTRTRGSIFNSETIEAMKKYGSGSDEVRRGMESTMDFPPKMVLGALHKLEFRVNARGSQEGEFGLDLFYVADFDTRCNGVVGEYWTERKKSDWESVKSCFHRVLEKEFGNRAPVADAVGEVQRADDIAWSDST